MTRIAIPAPTYLPSRRANTIQVMKMAQALAELGHEVRVLVPRPESEIGPDPVWEDLARHYGLQHRFSIVWLPVRAGWRSYDFGLNALRAARAWGAGLIYTRHPQAAALAAQNGRPTVLEVHDFPQGFAGPWLFRRFLRGRGARRLVAITHALLADLQAGCALPPPPFSLVAPDGVDLERFRDLPSPAEARAALGLPERFTAGYTGHLYPGRGIDLILQLAAGNPDIGFVLAGGNPEDVARVQSAAGDLSNLHLAGFVPNADLPRWQAACDVLLMPYQRVVTASSGGDIARYLSPMKLFEYLACGRAVMSSDLPPLREVLHPGCAVLLPPDGAPAWNAALRRLAADPSECRELGAAAARESEKYTWQARARRILAGLV